MIEVVQFDDGTFGLRNTMTGQILARHNRILSYKTEDRAYKQAERIVKKLNKTIRSLEKNNKV